LSHENSVDEAIKRCSGEGSRVFWDCNPDYPTHPIKTDYIDNDGVLLSSGRIRIKAWSFNLWDNSKKNGGYLTEEYIENLEASFTGFKKDRAIWGKWVAAEGVIYKHFNENMIVDAENLPEFKRFFAGVDWGYGHVGSILIFGEDHDGNIYLLEETAEKGKEIDWWVERKNKYETKYGKMQWYCDSARPEYVLRFGGVNAKKEVIEGIDTCSRLMNDGKFFVVRNKAKRWMQEVYSYIWIDHKSKEEPRKENDDSMDAMRYALHTLFHFEEDKEFSSSSAGDNLTETADRFSPRGINDIMNNF